MDMQRIPAAAWRVERQIEVISRVPVESKDDLSLGLYPWCRPALPGN